ncbi:MAG: hypothetical protein HRU38_16060 [Saccharospirillaceae bacterium]|nr:hypothetical protein [Pseudomonadales bacterium]NRB80157.1 hypothetical protein [Saccharospirillaceae bacterium]
MTTTTMTTMMNSNLMNNDKVDFPSMVKTIDGLKKRITESKQEGMTIEKNNQTKIVNIETQDINSNTLLESYKNKIKECNELNVEVKQLLLSIGELREENDTINNSISKECNNIENMTIEIKEINDKNNVLKVGVIKRNILTKELKNKINELSKSNDVYDLKLNAAIKKNERLLKVVKSIELIKLVVLNYFKMVNKIKNMIRK